MRIRPALHSEVDQLNHIALEAKAHWGYTHEQLRHWKASLLTEPGSIETWPTFVAEAQGQVAGFAQVDPEGDPWELISLWVLPQYMGKGFGKALLQQVRQAAFAAKQSCVHIDSDPNAAAFYLACGAVAVGEVSAPIPGQPARVRPQLRLATSAA
jgi:ribosomal protein S18 acetylase RimI-like enzyme